MKNYEWGECEQRLHTNIMKLQIELKIALFCS